MASIVFLKGVNVGGHRTFRPSVLASEMANLGVRHVGAAGTFVVNKPIHRSKLLREFRRRLPFETEAMICSRNEILRLATTNSFNEASCGPNIVRFVSILAKRPRTLPALPLNLPAGEEWLVRIVRVEGRFVFGMYRRSLRTITCLSKLERHLGGSITTRNWNTFLNLFKLLRARHREVAVR